MFHISRGKSIKIIMNLKSLNQRLRMPKEVSNKEISPLLQDVETVSNSLYYVTAYDKQFTQIMRNVVHLHV